MTLLLGAIRATLGGTSVELVPLQQRVANLEAASRSRPAGGASRDEAPAYQAAIGSPPAATRTAHP